ncbi:MAG: gamma carbonic anhydrase family protein [Desulfatirhabdiaceae bacterium]|nr:gamma carbonic anhydrase family protein [Desulfatirhabdiaceae bacterium]
MITGFNGFSPCIGADVWIDPFARLIGNITLKAGSSIWPGAVLRADDSEIIIGERSAVLDLCLLESPKGYPVIVEDNVLISHKACLHGAVVETSALIGIGAIVLDGSVVRTGALVGAAAVVPPGMEIPARMLALGQPARIIRSLTTIETDRILAQVDEINRKAAIYRDVRSENNRPE